MPIGHNLVKCNTCGNDFIVGDCIESECRPCQCKRLGHMRVPGVNICGRCGERMLDGDRRREADVGGAQDRRRKPLSEKEEAVVLANRILDRRADPDDDLAMLSRQFLRALEIVDRQEKALQEVDWEGQQTLELIHANRDAILKMHEEAAKRINAVLIGGGNKHDAEKLIYIGKVLHALSVFHPMHGESWIGWPEGTDQ